MRSTQARCPECGKNYKMVIEIIEMGGSCKQIGLALFGTCVCGGDIGGIGQLWRVNHELTKVAMQATLEDRDQGLGHTND